MRAFVVVLMLLPSSSIALSWQFNFDDVEAQQRILITPVNTCIKYNDVKRMITISCETATVSDIYNQINNNDVLDKQQHGVWLLNANLTINKGSTLTIDPKDTTWLKIIADEKTLAYGIHVHGS